MPRVLLLVVLGLGTVFGFASGFRHMRHDEYGWGPPPWATQAPGGMQSRMDAMAEACVRAARGAPLPGATPATPGAPAAP
jgi:hypothetical protein